MATTLAIPFRLLSLGSDLRKSFLENFVPSYSNHGLSDDGSAFVIFFLAHRSQYLPGICTEYHGTYITLARPGRPFLGNDFYRVCGDVFGHRLS